jgi:hypothetical protein
MYVKHNTLRSQVMFIPPQLSQQLYTILLEDGTFVVSGKNKMGLDLHVKFPIIFVRYSTHSVFLCRVP